MEIFNIFKPKQPLSRKEVVDYKPIKTDLYCPNCRAVLYRNNFKHWCSRANPFYCTYEIKNYQIDGNLYEENKFIEEIGDEY